MFDGVSDTHFLASAPQVQLAWCTRPLPVEPIHPIHAPFGRAATLKTPQPARCVRSFWKGWSRLLVNSTCVLRGECHNLGVLFADKCDLKLLKVRTSRFAHSCRCHMVCLVALFAVKGSQASTRASPVATISRTQTPALRCAGDLGRANLRDNS